MRFFNAVFALPLIASVMGSPVPAAEKRALAPSSSNPLDLVSILGDLKTKIVSYTVLTPVGFETDRQQPTIDLLKAGGGLVDPPTAEGYVTQIKDSFSEVKTSISGLSPDQVTGKPEDM